MAAPILQSIVSKTGRVLYKKGSSFISKSTYLRELRRIPKGMPGAGTFRSAKNFAQNLQTPAIAQTLNDIFGPPVGGGDWVSRVRKSEERFIDILGDNNQIG